VTTERETKNKTGELIEISLSRAGCGQEPQQKSFSAEKNRQAASAEQESSTLSVSTVTQPLPPPRAPGEGPFAPSCAGAREQQIRDVHCNRSAAPIPRRQGAESASPIIADYSFLERQQAHSPRALLDNRPGIPSAKRDKRVQAALRRRNGQSRLQSGDGCREVLRYAAGDQT